MQRLVRYCWYQHLIAGTGRPAALGRIAMNPVESLIKSLVRERVIVGVFGGFCYMVAGFLGLAVELTYLSPAAKQFLPLCYLLGLVGTSHSFLSYRIASALQALTAAPVPRKPE
jgi:hypothetical protein